MFCQWKLLFYYLFSKLKPLCSDCLQLLVQVRKLNPLQNQLQHTCHEQSMHSVLRKPLVFFSLCSVTHIHFHELLLRSIQKMVDVC